MFLMNPEFIQEPVSQLEGAQPVSQLEGAHHHSHKVAVSCVASIKTNNNFNAPGFLQ